MRSHRKIHNCSKISPQLVFCRAGICTQAVWHRIKFITLELSLGNLEAVMDKLKRQRGKALQSFAFCGYSLPDSSPCHSSMLSFPHNGPPFFPVFSCPFLFRTVTRALSLAWDISPHIHLIALVQGLLILQVSVSYHSLGELCLNHLPVFGL